MANIAITSQCNLKCEYCFTQDTYNTADITYEHMSSDVFNKSLDILLQSKIKQIAVLGGEPTLHPDFITFMEMAMQTGFVVKLFTNGFIPENTLKYLTSISDDKINIVVNINNLTQDINKIPIQVKKTLTDLNKKVLPGFNIYDKDLQLNPLLELIRTYNLKKKVRLGLAQPCLGYINRYLPVKHYSFVGRKILEFIQKAQNQSVKIILDCGFVPCMFGTADIQQYGIHKDTGLHCDPIPDILPDGSVISCYPLSRLGQKHIDNVETLTQVREEMKESQIEFRNAGIFKTCSICSYRKNGHCTGGCSAHKILRCNPINES
jgi:radical SAM protein with 4Fe4S-binding SPASM domain